MKTRLQNSVFFFVWVGLLGLAALAASASTTLIDLDFTGDQTGTTKVGLAATGLSTNDVWNWYSEDRSNIIYSSGFLTNMVYTDGSTSGVGLAITGVTGGYGNGVPDPMYGGYLYSTAGATISLTITNLGAGSYDFYFYGHGNQNNQNSVFQLSVGGVSFGSSEATTNGAGWNSSVWQAGVQYVVFAGVSVGAGQTIAIHVEPGSSPYSCLSGLQIQSLPTTGAPVVAESPASQTANSGATVSFSASASGSPSAIQWYSTNSLGTNPVSGGTNSPLVFTANDGTAGGYEAVFSNSFGMATTAMAVLTVVDPPVVATSPVSQTANAGASVTFTASATGGPASVQWYLINYLGTNAISGATNPTLTITASGPTADSYFAVFHNTAGTATTSAANLGVLNLPFVNGSFEINTNGATIPAGGYLILNAGATWMEGWTVGGPGNDIFVIGGTRGGYSPYAGYQWIAFHGINSATGGTLAHTFTTAAGQSYAVTFAVGEFGTGGGQSLTAMALAPNGALLGSNYCVPTAGVWNEFTLNFTAESTNSTLVFVANAGSGGYYTAVFTNAAGIAATTPALLTVDNPVFFTQQPQSMTTDLGANVTFSGAAGGDAPIVFQWQFDGTNIADATNASLVLNNVQLTNVGSYVLLATNASGWVASTNAVLSIVTTLQIPNASVAGSGTVTIPVNLIATGIESVMQFSLNFDPTVLTFVSISAGSGASSASFTFNTNPAVSGQIGLLGGSLGSTFSPGTQEIVDVTFTAILRTNSGTTTIGFGGSPTLQRVIDTSFDQLPVNYLAGTVTVTPTSLEGDIWPRSNGGYGIDVNDWQQEARFVVGLDIVSNSLEFQRADCAPRSTSGDGVIDALDLVEVGRYAVGLDPFTPIGGPTGPAPEFRLAKSGTIHPLDSASDRTLSLVPMTNVPNAVMVQLLAAGDEGALVFSVSFDPSIVSFVSATKAAGIAAFAVNSNNAATGSLGIAASRSSFAAGTNPIAQLVFSPVTYSNTATLSFADVPANRSVSDVTGTTHLLATYQNGALAVSGSSWPMLSLSSTGSQITLSWPSSATNFVVQTTTNFSSAWAAAGGSPVSNGSTISLTLPAPANTAFYRLSQEP